MNESIEDLKRILVNTEYEKSVPCIQKILDHYGVTTLGQLDNAPRILGVNICGHSTWELISTIRERTLNPPVVPKIPKKAPKPQAKVAPKATKVKVEKIKVPEKEVLKVEETKEDKE